MNYSSPSDISAAFAASARQKAGMAPAHQIVAGILGGAFISLGGLLALMVAGGMSDVLTSNPGLVRFAFGAMFPVGLIMIVLAGAQLFTSDCAVMPYGWMNGNVTVVQWLRTWGVIYFSNFIGALLIAWMFVYQSGILSAEPWQSYLVNLASAKSNLPWMKVFVKGIGANWLVCIAVWMSYAAKDVIGKVIAIWIPVMCFVVLGMEHSIANMFFIPAAIMSGADIPLSAFIINNLIPATAGNIIGGAVFVALPYWFLYKSPSKQRETVKTESTSLSKFEPNLN